VLVACLLCLLSLSLPAAGADRDLRMVAAVKAADKAAVRALAKQRVDVNASEGDGRTALHWAAYTADQDTVSVLIELGARLNAVTDLGITPLWVACTAGSTAVVEKLLSAGADPNIAPDSNGTPLMIASRTGNLKAVKLLLAHGADPNAKEGSRGQTALMWAVSEGHPEVVRALLDRGANIRARSMASRRYVLLCCQDFEGDPGGGDYVDEGGETPLLFAARAGEIQSAELLLRAGADIEEAAPTGASPLVLAAHSDQGAFAAFLLDWGANPDSDGGGYTALHAAVLRGNLDLVKALLRHGANPNSRQMKGTPAKRYSGFGLDKRMIGATPFLLATRAAQLDAMRVLASNGGDPNLGLTDGTTPLMAVAMRPVRGSRFAENRVVEAMKVAIELGATITARNLSGDTALHFAATRRLDQVVQFLVDRGAPVNATNNGGHTPLAATLAPVPAAKGAGQTTFDEYNFLSVHTAATAALLRQLGGRE
jgi:ankyrin repeat protein